MTVEELSSRITISELEEWAVYSRIRSEERKEQEMINRVESRLNRMKK